MTDDPNTRNDIEPSTKCRRHTTLTHGRKYRKYRKYQKYHKYRKYRKYHEYRKYREIMKT